MRRGPAGLELLQAVVLKLDDRASWSVIVSDGHRGVVLLCCALRQR
jgi:hypothetical protein